MWIEKKALEALSHLCDGDARVALNGLQMAIQSQTSKFSQSKASLHSPSQTRSGKGSFLVKGGKQCDKAADDRNTYYVSGSDNKMEEEIKAVIIRTEHIKEGLQKSHLLYDRAGEHHTLHFCLYNVIFLRSENGNF